MGIEHIKIPDIAKLNKRKSTYQKCPNCGTRRNRMKTCKVCGEFPDED